MALSWLHTLALVPLLLLLVSPALPTAMAVVPPFSCGGAAAAKGYAFCNKALPVARRVDDLVSRLTLPEKVAQLGDQAPSVPRLGVPKYKWWSEGLHGVAVSGRGIHFNGTMRAATSFPQVILSAASFDQNLWYRIGQVVGTEARAFYNLGQAEGLTIWSPNVNIFRDPRWGRGQESPGEDPAVAARYAVAFVRGMQGNSSTTLQASACCKHVTAYDLEAWNGVDRYSFYAKVTAQDLADTYQPPFKSCVTEGKASCIMCAYTGINGIPACANSDLLSKTVKGTWGLNGYVASDCDAVAIMRDAQRYTATPEEAVAASIRAGLDMNCGTYVQQHAAAAIQKGKLSEQDINKALKNLFAVRMRLGHFNGDPGSNEYGGIGASQVCTPAHQALALEAAQDGIVLLKNDAGILPLSQSKVTSAAVIGPNADDVMALLANYYGLPCATVTPLQALRGYVRDTRFLKGCNSAACTASAAGDAARLASSTDYVFLFMGLSQTQEREGLDRVSLLLPGNQQSLITGVAAAAKRPVILVLLSGGPIDVSFAQLNPKIGAILWAGYPGQSGGLAIARVLFGEHNPGGRLPVTWYPQEFTKVPMTDMRMRADAATGYPGRSYRFYRGKTVYKFGFGLSYSKFSRRFISAPKKTPILTGLKATVSAVAGGAAVSYEVEQIGTAGCDKLKFPAIVAVQNHGPMDGKHTVMLFLRWPNATAASGGRPARQLVGFHSHHLKAGETAHVRFDVSPCGHFSRASEDGKKVIDKGSHFVMLEEEDELEISFMA